MRSLMLILAPTLSLVSHLSGQEARTHLAGDRFALLTECASLAVDVIGDDDMAAMAERRLRAVGLLGEPVLPPRIEIVVPLGGWPILRFFKFFTDPITGLTLQATAFERYWENRSMNSAYLFLPSVPLPPLSDNRAVASNMLDDFILDYLQVNEEYCE